VDIEFYDCCFISCYFGIKVLHCILLNRKMDKQSLVAVLNFLKKNNFKETETLLRKESGIAADELPLEDIVNDSKADVKRALSPYRSSEDPTLFSDHYMQLKSFVDTSLDAHKCELQCLMYPIFIHMYYELVVRNCEEEARKFFDQFSTDQDECYIEDLQQIALATKPHQIQDCQIFENFKNNKFVLNISRDAYSHFKRFLLSKNFATILAVVSEKLSINAYEGASRNKLQVERTSGAMMGDSAKDANKVKVLHGLLKEPEINVQLEDDDEDVTGPDDSKSSKKRKSKKDTQMKKAKSDPNAPPTNRIPLPEMKDSDKLERARCLRELSKKVNLGPDSLPSILFYTFMNCFHGLTSLDCCEDASMLAAGFSDSLVRVWSLNTSRLRTIKQPEDLNVIDKEMDDVLEQIMDDNSASDSKQLLGHSGPVYSASFSPDKSHLISSSEDGTVRLWSLYTWTNLVSYKGHMFPVWAVKYGPHGHYFASAGYDRTARLWSVDHHQPLRIFAGHYSDVDSVDFHPNSNYIATGSTDRTVRLWDVVSGNCVRTMTGHKGAVHTLAFSPNGRYLVSAGLDASIILWDLSTGDSVSKLLGHTDAVYSLAFSQEGSVLASGGRDNCVKLWDVNKALAGQPADRVPSDTSDGRVYEIGSYPTKSTPVLCVHFNRRNLLLAGGSFASH